MPSTPCRTSRAYASCTTSSASLTLPSIRYATSIRRWRRSRQASATRGSAPAGFPIGLWSISLVGRAKRLECDIGRAMGCRCHNLNRTSVLVSSSPHLRTEKAMTSLAVEVRGLTKTYPGGVQAVREIDFDVPSGEVFGLLGPNGAGKSTTVGMLTGTVAPTAGTARLAGPGVAGAPLEARRVSAVVFQEAVLDRPLTGRRNLEIHARLWGLDAGAAAERLGEVVDAFGLREVIGRPVSNYSGGQRRRLEPARALLSEPQVLFLDEPTVGLDPLIRHELLDLIDGLRRRREMTVVLTTHYLDEAERLCDRVAIMHAGRIVALDRPQALL